MSRTCKQRKCTRCGETLSLKRFRAWKSYQKNQPGSNLKIMRNCVQCRWDKRQNRRQPPSERVKPDSSHNWTKVHDKLCADYAARNPQVLPKGWRVCPGCNCLRKEEDMRRDKSPSRRKGYNGTCRFCLSEESHWQDFSGYRWFASPSDSGNLPFIKLFPLSVARIHPKSESGELWIISNDYPDWKKEILPLLRKKMIIW